MFYGASAFNQPLSFDTSSVTTMKYMFYVRSCPCPAPNLQTSPPLRPACTVIEPSALPPPPGPHLTPLRVYALDSTLGRTPWRSTSR
eukprot:scaffold41628_cov49-Phaeocystis_antarctica.AAC.2